MNDSVYQSMPCCARSRSLLICLHLVEHLEEEVGELLLVDLAIPVGIGDLEELVELLLSGHVFSNTGGKGLKALLHLCNEFFLLDKAVAIAINHAEKTVDVRCDLLAHSLDLGSVHRLLLVL